MKELLVLLGGLVILATGGGFLVGKALGSEADVQPIAFNHQKHVAFLECTACHQYAQEYAVAGLPQAPFCMTCHASPVTKSPEAAKVRGYAEDGKSIPWVRLFKLRDYVTFSHKPHVRAGVSCASCHGDVAQQGVLTSGFGRGGVGGLYGMRLMNWCLDCHREKAAAGAVPQWLETPALATDCVTCHK